MGRFERWLSAWVALAMAVGPIRYDPKLPAIAAAWMGVNLMLTCIFEETLFRGVIQHRLSSLVVRRPRWNWLPLNWLPVFAASVLFGLAHAGGGPVLVAVAAIAGLGYGIAYAITGRVEAAIVAHFTLNSIHFFGFTYPYAVR